MITYCCKDCGGLIERHTALYKGGRCCLCARKQRPSNYKDGRTLIQHYCIDCGTKISLVTSLYGQKRCGSCSHKGKNHPMFGKHISEEHKIKLSKSHSGANNYFFGKHLSNKHCLKISKAKKGIKRSKETCLNMSKANKGKRLSDETKEKISNSHKGKKHYNYIDGLSRSPYCRKFNDSLKQKIRKRDNYHCRICNKTSKRNLSVHHIDYNKQNCNEDNLISLCCKCHLKTNYNRDYWFAYCIYLMENKNA